MPAHLAFQKNYTGVCIAAALLDEDVSC
jgi:hypothetical protein